MNYGISSRGMDAYLASRTGRVLSADERIRLKRAVGGGYVPRKKANPSLAFGQGPKPFVPLKRPKLPLTFEEAVRERRKALKLSESLARSKELGTA